jgi:predicted nucleic acid-binding protein
MPSLVASGAFRAMIDATDQHRTAAATFARSTAADIFYPSAPLFVETMVLTKARSGAAAAINLGHRSKASTRFVVVDQIDNDRRATWDGFSRYVDKDWSYVDCSVLALARRLRVVEVFAFDHPFDQMAEFVRMPIGS